MIDRKCHLRAAIRYIDSVPLNSFFLYYRFGGPSRVVRRIKIEKSRIVSLSKGSRLKFLRTTARWLAGTGP